MNELSTTIRPQLPAKIEDLQKFVLVGREKITAVRAEIRAISKLGLAEEVRRQKLDEAQMISEAVLDAEVKIGSLTAEIPKATQASGNQYTEKWKIDSGGENPISKSKTIKELGFSQKQVERFEKLAKHPEIVEQAKSEARERDDIVSRTFVLQKIDEAVKPHIAYNSGNNEWYTPPEYIEAARSVLGEIELDPASSKLANKTVQAVRFYTAQDDGLKQEWKGKVWMNPPYASELIGQFCNKLAKEYQSGNVTEAIILVNNATETAWFGTLVEHASGVIFPKARVKFRMPNGETGAPLQGQAVLYLGDNTQRFMKEFKHFGWGAFL